MKGRQRRRIDSYEKMCDKIRMKVCVIKSKKCVIY